LRKRREFEEVYSSGKRFFGRFLVMYVKDNGCGRNRYGIVAGKKVGKAVTRNRVKRRLREIVRLYDVRMKKGYDVVLVARPTTAMADFVGLGHDYESLLRRSKLLK